MAEPEDGIKNQLLEFGFDADKVTKAVQATQSQGTLQAALDWIESEDNSHNDKELLVEKEAITDDALSLKCNQCGKLFGNADFAQLHATKTGHDDFSQSTDRPAPLSEAEREAKLADLRARLAAKHAAEKERAAEEARRNELLRRKANKETVEMRRTVQEKEMQRAYEQRIREKREDAELRARIKQQIEEDRQRVRERNQSISEEVKVVVQSVEPVKSDEARIQVKLPSGLAIRETFPAATTTLANLHETIMGKTGLPDHLRLVIPYPRRELDLASEGNRTLAELGLAPSASLMLI